MRRVQKKEPGIHREVLQGAHVKAATESESIFEENRDGLQGCAENQNVPDVIVIEDDDGDSEVENDDSEAVLRRSQSQYQCSSSELNGSKSSFETYELSGSSSDEEDCIVIEPHSSIPPSFLNQKHPQTRKRPRASSNIERESHRKRRSSPSDLLDCEIVLDFDGKVKQDWEEAALRRRTGKARRAESEESTSASIQANGDARKSPKGTARINMQFHLRRSWEPASGAGSSSHAKERKEDGALDQQDSNLNVSGIGSDESAEEALSTQNPLKCRLHIETNGTLTTADNTVTDRETLKRTEEFRQADEEEWARRRVELQKQAEGVQRERKKRRLEAERRLVMEARQKRRLEEIRLTQLKEEQASGFKDLIRDRVQSELERIAATCRDMATLLRRLGVPVEGGAFATDQQVTAAYKKALLSFHPDRAAALAKSDPTSQVEAEEKFKLVSRMKGTLPLVSSSFFNEVF